MQSQDETAGAITKQAAEHEGTEPAHDTPAAANPFEGHIDFFGYHDSAAGFFFCGWISHPWPAGEAPPQVQAHLAERSVVGDALTTYYFREDVQSRGIGFVFFIACPPDQRGDFDSLEIAFTQATHRIYPTPKAPCLTGPELVEWLDDILSGGEEQSHRRRMRALLLRTQDAAAQIALQARTGFIDFYGYHSAAGAWVLCGWISHDQQIGLHPEAVLLSFEGGNLAGDALATLYPRSDLASSQQGVVFMVQGSGAPLGGLCSVSFTEAGVPSTLFLGPPTQRLREAELVSRVRPMLAAAATGEVRDDMAVLLARQPYAGADTLAALSEKVLLEIDEAVFCPPDGLLVIGWYLAKPGTVRDVRLRCGTLATSLQLDACIRVDRSDVLAAVGAEHGFDEARCGFLAFFPHAVTPGARCYFEIETARREVGYRTVPRSRLEGITAIRRILECFELRYHEVPPGFDRVAGPALESLNAARLRRPAITLVQYGSPPPRPRFSVIVPLYGRMDFAEYQLGLFSQHPPNAEVEFLYVVDDPPQRRDAQRLFTSVHERFRVPFRAVLLDRNMGFAPASNIGLQHASGEFVVFLNSDAFPGTPDWLERLAARLVADPRIGVIAPLLRFADGSVQHQGMYFKRLDEFGGWLFGQHIAKGLRYAGGPALRRCVSITGACMMLRRSLALTLGGFDEGYIIGDFEDSDLCLKLHAMGLDSVVDPEVFLYHLERQSQTSAAQAWRMNLTLYNAWRHERRWAAAITSHPAGTAAVDPMQAA